MTLHSFVNRLTQLFSWLYYRHLWEEWELLAVGIAVLIPLILIAIRQRKEKAGRAYSHHNRERSPIIGVKLANGKHNRQAPPDSKRAGLRSAETGKNKTDDATQVINSSEQIRQLQHEITKHQQTEARLERELAELTDANEKLRQEVDEARQAEEHLRKQTIELLDANPELQEGHGGRKHAGRHSHDQMNSTPSAHKHPVDSKHADEPLDVEKLKAIAELAKQIQQRSHPELS